MGALRCDAGHLSVENTLIFIVEPSSPMSRPELSSISRHAGHNFHEIFHLRQGVYSDMPTYKILEMMKSTNLDVRAMLYFFQKNVLDTILFKNNVLDAIMSVQILSFILCIMEPFFAERSYPVTSEFCERHP